MKAKTLMNKIIIVGGLSACLLLGGCGAGQAADATSAESTVEQRHLFAELQKYLQIL